MYNKEDNIVMEQSSPSESGQMALFCSTNEIVGRQYLRNCNLLYK